MYSIYCLYTFFFYFYWRYLLLSFYNMINVACHEKHLEKVAIGLCNVPSSIVMGIL